VPNNLKLGFGWPGIGKLHVASFASWESRRKNIPGHMIVEWDLALAATMTTRDMLTLNGVFLPGFAL
jgi:hypothetical protein